MPLGLDATGTLLAREGRSIYLAVYLRCQEAHVGKCPRPPRVVTLD